MKTYKWVVLSYDGCLVLVAGQNPPSHGSSIGCRVYRVEASSRQEAVARAKERYAKGDSSDPYDMA